MLFTDESVIVGKRFSVIVCVADATLMQEFSVQVALYVPTEALIVLPVAPVLHVILPAQALAVNVVLLP